MKKAAGLRAEAPGAGAPKAAGTKPAPQASPANFPRVDRETQQSRDSQRRRVEVRLAGPEVDDRMALGAQLGRPPRHLEGRRLLDPREA